MILPKEPKRCGLFLYFDKHGIVDDYVVYMLDEMKKSIDYLLVICNGFVEHESLNKLRNSADEVLCRANVGYDLGGYREGLFYIGWKNLSEFDELVMFNYTMMGPVHSFQKMFDTMAQKDLDFWGITKHHRVDPDPFGQIVYGFLPEHIQSHFFAVRRELFTSYHYRNFMVNRTNPDSYTAAVCTYEAIFTKYFSDLGYKGETYSDSSDFEGIAYYPIIFEARNMVEEKKCPIIKRRSFFTDYDNFLENTAGESTVELYEYLKKENLFDQGMLWDNILRLENHEAVHLAMHLNCILSGRSTEHKWEQRNAIAVLIEKDPSVIFVKKYLNALPGSKADIYLVGTKDDIDLVKKYMAECESLKETVCEDSSYRTLLKKAADAVSGKGYDITGVLCLNHIEKDDKAREVISWKKADWDNLAMNENVIGNLFEEMYHNERLGLMVPAKPRHGSLFNYVEKEWCGRFNEAKGIISKLTPQLNVNAKNSPKAPLGGSFFIRTDFLKGFTEFAEEACDKELMMLCLSAYVQSLRYYTCVAYSDRYAQTDLTNQIHMFRENNKVLFERYQPDKHIWVRHYLREDANKREAELQ